jgi:hypothetical protein
VRKPKLGVELRARVTIPRPGLWFRLNFGERNNLNSSRLNWHHSLNQELHMNPHNQSGYDPIGDSRTGRPPLPDERERMRRNQAEGMEPSGLSPAGAAPFSQGEQSLEGQHDGSGMAQSLRGAGETVSAHVADAASSAMEQGQELASAASNHIQTYKNDLLAFARRRPLAALFGAAALGLLIGMLTRGRS